MFKKNELVLFLKDRVAITLLIASIFIFAIILTLTAINVRVSDVQLPIRYSDYGFTHLYRDKWYTLLSFALIGLISLLTSFYLAVKLHQERRNLSLGLLGISSIILSIDLVITIEIFRLVSFSV